MNTRGSLVRLSERHQTTSESKPENHRQVYSVLVALSESKLIRLFKSVEVLREELQLIRSPNGEPVEAVIATQAFLKIWSDELDQILAAKQAKETNRRLRNWDNEGGAVDHAPKQHLSSVSDSVT